ncbi:MAG TPA: hypothetical protein DCQ98_18345 [Planctomycetaceae bacterium]|nr:hypothetical protein [Planctomycetaceae bacterium]
MAANGRGPIVVTLILLIAVVVAGFGWWWNVLGPGARIRRDAQRAVDEAKSSSGEAGEGSGSAVVERFEPTSIAPNDAGFVGTVACVDCHAERVREFVTTDHFRTSRPLDPSRFDAPGGPATGQLPTSDPHVAFRIDLIDGVPHQQVRRTGEQPLDESAPLEIAIGAGNYDEDFFFWRGERLFQAPLVWYHPDRFWCNAPGFVDGEVDFRRQVLPRCLECHATYAEPLAGSVNAYRKESIGWGIGCERCHGPAAEHVSTASSRSGRSRDAGDRDAGRAVARAVDRPVRPMPRQRDGPPDRSVLVSPRRCRDRSLPSRSLRSARR